MGTGLQPRIGLHGCRWQQVCMVVGGKKRSTYIKWLWTIHCNKNQTFNIKNLMLRSNARLISSITLLGKIIM